MNSTIGHATESIPCSVRCRIDECLAAIRRAPVIGVAAAFAAGMVLTMLPVGRLARLAWALAKPILLVLGLVKLAECCPCRRESHATDPAMEPLLDSPVGPPPEA